MKCHLEPVNIEDIDRLQEILENSTENRAKSHYNNDEISKLTKNAKNEFENMILYAENNIYKAVKDGNILGFGGVNMKYNVINCLYVSPEYTDNGVGSMIIEHIEQKAQKNGYSGLIVFSSLNAVDFYKKKGYKKVHNIKGECDIISEDIEHIMMVKKFGSSDLIIDENISSKLDFEIDKL